MAMMPAKRKEAVVNRSHKVGLQEDNALQRVLHLPVVNAACNNLQKTYAATKESHPLVASMCEAYERGIQAASSLAMWSLKPVVQKLEPQFTAANVLACQGLDLLEQRIPALHKPVDDVTSQLKDSICTHVQSAMHSIADALDRILGLAAESCDQAQNTIRDVAGDARSSQVSHLAEAGVEAVSGKVEKLVNLLFPKPEHNSAHDDSGVPVSREGSSSSIVGRIRVLACNVSQHAYRQTTRTIQYSRDKGQEWAMWIPGLDGSSRQSSTKTQQAASNVQNTASGWPSKGQRKAPEKKEERKNEDDRASMPEESARAQSLMSSLTQNLQVAYLSTISTVKEAHFTICSAAGQLLQLSPHVSKTSSKVGMLWGILQTVTDSFLGTVFHYVPVPKLLVKEEENVTVMADGSETHQRQESSQPGASHTQERWAPYPLRGEWRSNRGHYPLSFLNLDEPHLVQQAPFRRRSPAFEADYTSARKSAFFPYKEAVSSRRLSEGLYHSSPEAAIQQGSLHRPLWHHP